MATENTKISTEENKSLLEKTKDTLLGLKNQAEGLLFTKKEDEIEGMSRANFEATKEKLETTLHLEKEHDVPQQEQQQLATTNIVESKESDLSQFGGGKSIYGANMDKFQQVNKEDFIKPPEILLQKTEVHDDRKDELKYSQMDKTEIHVLPTIHVEEKPIIIEKEIEYSKPVEIRQTIIHKEKPIIIEQPIIREKHEHYREAPEYAKTTNKIVTETVSEQDTGNQDTEALLNLRKQRIDEYSNNSQPIVKREKEVIQLETDVREQPTQVHEKQVIYQQPVEIQKTHIEKIKPIVREEVTFEKEHIHEKLAPEVHRENAKKTTTEQFFSEDASAISATTAVADNLSTVTNDTATHIDAEPRLALGAEQTQRKEEVL